MSILFGRWNFDGEPIDPTELRDFEATVASYAPDEQAIHSTPGLVIGHRAFHTTSRSRCNRQPYESAAGAVITWDGRLDNRDELVRALDFDQRADPSEVEIVACAYDRWDQDCLRRFVGDWSLAVWDRRTHSLLLAVDFLGCRHLFYRLDQNGIRWCTALGPLVTFDNSRNTISTEYVQGWLQGFPSASLTPYCEIHGVPPANYLLVKQQRHSVRGYWEFDPSRKTLYRSDREYEDHFRCLFRQSVHRRLSADQPVLAELSGGMDSSAIVCVAHNVVEQGESETPRLDTVSYFSESEPSWQDQPYFTKVEEKIGRTGCHIKVADSATIVVGPGGSRVTVTPAGILQPTDARDQFTQLVDSQGNRVLLSGIGGDEFLGGVPTPTPELADLLVTGKWLRLLRQSVAWGLAQRTPLIHLLGGAIQMAIGSAFRMSADDRAVPWLGSGFKVRQSVQVRPAPPRLVRASFRENLRALDLVRRQLSISIPSTTPFIEKRYPYLDRDLLEFLFSIPREQLLRPHQRRSLMRRAMTGIVPGEVLNRKRKAFVIRTPLLAVTDAWDQIIAEQAPLLCEELGFVDRARFSEALSSFREGGSIPLLPLCRTVTLELWLRHIEASHSLAVAT